jgi:hypothetical protein
MTERGLDARVFFALILLLYAGAYVAYASAFRWLHYYFDEKDDTKQVKPLWLAMIAATRVHRATLAILYPTFLATIVLFSPDPIPWLGFPIHAINIWIWFRLMRPIETDTLSMRFVGEVSLDKFATWMRYLSITKWMAAISLCVPIYVILNRDLIAFIKAGTERGWPGIF